MSVALKDRIAKFERTLPKGSEIRINLGKVESTLDVSENKIMPGGKFEAVIKYNGGIVHDVVLSVGTFGIKNGEPYATDGTVATVDQVSYIASNGRWLKK